MKKQKLPPLNRAGEEVLADVLGEAHAVFTLASPLEPKHSCAKWASDLDKSPIVCALEQLLQRQLRAAESMFDTACRAFAAGDINGLSFWEITLSALDQETEAAHSAVLLAKLKVASEVTSFAPARVWICQPGRDPNIVELADKWTAVERRPNYGEPYK